MPFINIKVVKGVLPEEKRQEMIARVSDVVAEIEAGPENKEKLLPHTWCVIEEVECANWGIGGNALTPEMLQAVLSG